MESVALIAKRDMENAVSPGDQPNQNAEQADIPESASQDMVAEPFGSEDGKKRKVALHVAYIGAGYAVSRQHEKDSFVFEHKPSVLSSSMCIPDWQPNARLLPAYPTQLQASATVSTAAQELLSFSHSM